MMTVSMRTMERTTTSDHLFDTVFLFSLFDVLMPKGEKNYLSHRFIWIWIVRLYLVCVGCVDNVF
jgi:hypothetical protein